MDSSSLDSNVFQNDISRRGKKKSSSEIKSKTHAIMQLNSAPKLLTQEPTISTITGKDNDLPLRVDPQQIRFESIRPGILYVMTFSVRNATKVAQRIRIEPPKTGIFALNYIPAGAVAPGLDVRAEIECQVPEKSDLNFFKDCIVTRMGPHKVEIPIYASKPAPDIVFESMLDLGPVVEGQSMTKVVQFTNEGQVKGTISLKTEDKSRLKIEPTNFDLYPNGLGMNKVSVSVRFDAKDLGAFREFVKVNVIGNPEPMILDVNARVLQQKLIILSSKNNSILEKYNFGTLFYGENETVMAKLVNSGPQTVSFTIAYVEDEDRAAAAENALTSSHGQEDIALAIERAVSVSPSEGILQPYGEIPVTFCFSPKLPAPLAGFRKQFQDEHRMPKSFYGRVVVESTEGSHGVSVELSGVAAMPSVTVSPMVLRFGGCPVYDRRDILVSVMNNSPAAVDFNFSKIAQFKVHPSSGQLQPKQTQSVVVSFLPSQLGKFKNVFHMVAAGGLVDIEVRVVGDSSGFAAKKTIVEGTDKGPDDFKPTYKFVEPGPPIATTVSDGNLGGTMKSTSNFRRPNPWEDPDFESSTSWDEVYDNRQSGILSVNNDEVTYSLQQLQKRAEHKRHYHEFLKQSHQQRLEKKRLAASQRLSERGRQVGTDPFGPNMGLEKDLEPPQLKVPKGGEPLWLERRIGDDGGGRGRRIPVDENRLMIKKYSDIPSTQAEIRDCAKSLTPDEQRAVIGSHKVGSCLQ